MNGKSKAPEHERRDWTVILILLLFGFLCVLLAGQWAIRFTSTWKLDSNMQSNLDPNSDFLTNRPVGYYEPLDPSILTQPVWMNIFLTPGASGGANTAIPQTNIPTGTNTPVLTASNTPVNPINTPTVIYNTPTNTPIYYPPPPSTRTPKPPPTNTPITPLPSADLSLAKDDGVANVNPGDTITYTVRVTNNGPTNVTGTILSDPVATGSSKTAVNCSPAPGQCVTPPTIAELESGTFALPTLNNGQFYEINITANVTATSGSVTNTATVTAPAGVADPVPGNNSASDADTVNLVADLGITVTDNATHYAANAVKNYVITVYNAGPSDVTGATVTNIFSNGNIVVSSVTWSCVPSAGASCTPGPVTGSNLTNEPVNLNSGSSVTFYLDAQVVPAPSNDLVNDVTVTAPAGVTDAPGNNSATDTDTLITADPPPGNIEIGSPPNNIYYALPEGNSLTLNVTTIANGDVGTPDLVYYEFLNGGFVYMDMVIIQISDGNNWYTIFNWGDNARDTNSNLDYAILPFPTLPPFPPPEEPDERAIPQASFYNTHGVTIDIDAIVPPGTYPWLRIIAPMDGNDNQLEIDAIEVLP